MDSGYHWSIGNDRFGWRGGSRICMKFTSRGCHPSIYFFSIGRPKRYDARYTFTNRKGKITLYTYIWNVDDLIIPHPKVAYQLLVKWIIHLTKTAFKFKFKIITYKFFLLQDRSMYDCHVNSGNDGHQVWSRQSPSCGSLNTKCFKKTPPVPLCFNCCVFLRASTGKKRRELQCCSVLKPIAWEWSSSKAR